MVTNRKLVVHCYVTKQYYLNSCENTDYSGEGIHHNHALGDKFLKFGMVLLMGSVCSKSIANEMSLTSGDL